MAENNLDALILAIEQLSESFENNAKQTKTKGDADKDKTFNEGFKSKQRTTEAVLALLTSGQIAATMGVMVRNIATELLNSVKAEFKDSYSSRQEKPLDATKKLADEMSRAGIKPSREFLNKYLQDRHSLETRALEGRRMGKEVGGIMPDWYYSALGAAGDWLTETTRGTKKKLDYHQNIHSAYKLHGD